MADECTVGSNFWTLKTSVAWGASGTPESIINALLPTLGEVTSNLVALAMIIELVVDGIDGIASLEYTLLPRGCYPLDTF